MAFPFVTASRIIDTMASPDLPEEILNEIRREYPTILTTAQVAEMMQCTIGDVRDKVHSRELPAMRWGQQFRFFRDEVLASMRRVGDDDQNAAAKRDAP